MLRKSVLAAFALIVLSGSLWAAEYAGKVRKVDPERMLLTVSVDGRDRTYPIDAKAQFLDEAGRALRDGVRSRRLREGVDVKVSTSPKEQITRVQLGK
jgi:hypothetical protein